MEQSKVYKAYCLLTQQHLQISWVLYGQASRSISTS